MPTLVLQGDASGAVKAIEAERNAALKLIPTLEDIVNAGKKVEQQHQESFGDGAINQLTKYAAGAFTIKKALDIVNSALQTEIDLRKQLAGEDKTALTSIGQLSAAGGTKADLAFARKLEADGLVSSPSEAAQATTGIVKARLTDQERAYAYHLAERRDINPSEVGQFALDIKGFQQRTGGTFEDDAKKVFALARTGKQTPSEIAAGISKLSKTAQDEGISQNQLLATFTALGASATTRKEAVSESEKIFTGKAELSDYGPEIASLYAQQLAAAQGAPGAPEVPNLTDVDPRSKAAKFAEFTKGKLNTDIKDQTSEWENNFESFSNIREKNIRDRGGSAMGLWLERQTVNIAHKLGIGENRKSEEFLRKQTEMMERDQRSTPPPSGRQE